MELNITHFFNNADAFDYSASRYEMSQNAAKITWQNAVNDSKDYMLLDNQEKIDAAKEFISGFGAWSDDEISAWTVEELNALLLQFIAGDIRESNLDTENPDWFEYQEQCEQGNASCRLFGGELSTDGQVYYYIGS